MNKNYERCTRCNRRKLLTTGCLRKWLKPIECKHVQRSVDNNRNFNNTDIDNCKLLPECKTTIKANKFVKFWKSKLVINGSVRSLQRYFSNKISSNECVYTSNLNHEPSTSSEHKNLTIADTESHGMDCRKIDLVKCQHLGYSVLRGHYQHASDASCDIYCQLSKYVFN